MRTLLRLTERSSTQSLGSVRQGTAADAAAHWDMLEQIVEHDSGRLTAADLVAEVATGRRQVWLAPKAICITEIIDYPRCRSCRIAVAGIGAQAVVRTAATFLERWARSQGCRKLEFVGRLGWLRAGGQWRAALAEFRPMAAIMEKDL